MNSTKSETHSELYTEPSNAQLAGDLRPEEKTELPLSSDKLPRILTSCILVHRSTIYFQNAVQFTCNGIETLRNGR